MDRFVKITSCLAVAMFIWYVAADRSTPFTSNARVKAVVTPVIPKVSGTLIDVQAVNTQAVPAGSLLAQIDPRPFELVLERRKAELELATQDVGASSSEVERAQAQLVRAQANLESVKIQTARWLELERKGLIPRAKADEARAQLSDAQGAVDVAQAEYNSATKRLGSSGSDNPKVRTALVNLAEAELDLTYTELRSPSDGGVVNLSVAVGAYAQAGQSIMTFIDGRDIWIEAYMTENNVGQIDPGDRVSVVLDTHPGRVFDGQVESIVSAAFHDNLGTDGLPNPTANTNWLREPQRFPIRITLDNYRSANSDDDVKLFLNGQADVVIYTSDNPLMNALGLVYIRVMSLFSYLY
ncbi:HlyD family secretion protein [Vibrio maerlii]|uniref:HlyD family secretion protein n=1 Tax=Vibrio maerlii TaxID=2231648 RepID=UPI000E3D59C0|nr:HlyD family secretion protein [Vibrio maerlii]